MKHWAVRLLFFTFAAPSLGQDLRIELLGAVVDKMDRGIPGAQIYVSRAGKVLASAATESDGSYRLSFERGGPIEVYYRHSEWFPTGISGLSGLRNQQINKILLKETAVLSDAERREARSWLDAIRALDKANGVLAIEVANRYASAEAQLRKREPLVINPGFASRAS